MEAHLKALGRIGICLGTGQWTVRIDIRRAPDTLPIRYRAARRAIGNMLIKAAGRAAIRMVITGHDEHRFYPTREIPEARERFFRAIHGEDELREQALLLISLWNEHFIQIDPV